jgi:polyisoprenoid-binding protein YceI
MRLPAGEWKIDSRHSELGFRVRHLGVSSVKGSFARFDGTLRAGAQELRAEGSVEVASVDSGDERRDEFLRSAEFFDCERYPRLIFSGAGARPSKRGRAQLEGALTIREITLPLTIVTSFEEPGPDGRLAVRGSGELNRTDYRLRFPTIGGYGDALVGETVKVLLEICALQER